MSTGIRNFIYKFHIFFAIFILLMSSSFAQKFKDDESNRMLIFNTAMDELSDSLQYIDIQLVSIAKLKIPNQQKLKIMNYITTYKNEANNLLDAAKVIDSAIRLALLVNVENDIKKLRGKYVSQICFDMPSKLAPEWYVDASLKSRIEMSKEYGKEVFASSVQIGAIEDLIKKTNVLGIKFINLCNESKNLNNW